MQKAKVVFVVLIVALVALVAVLRVKPPEEAGEGSPLVMFCAAGMKDPVTDAVAKYEKETGRKVQLQFGGSGTLLGNLQVASGDLYLAADNSHIEIAREKGLVAEVFPVARIVAGIAVPAGNPAGVQSIDDLLREDLRIGFAVPEAASVGKAARSVLEKQGTWKALSERAALMTGTVNELANAVKLGTLDAAVVWNAVALQYPELTFVRTPEFDAEPRTITMGVLKASKQPTAAIAFARYLTARDRGLEVFATYDFEPVEGDLWIEHPDILLYSGAMLRPAITEALEEFQEREGVTIRPVYNGCGILVSQMKAGENPDAYFSCDVKFLDMVQERFRDAVTVSGNDMVILTARDNPKEITGLADLTRSGLRLGLAHPDKSALGFLARYMLEQQKLYQPIIDAGNLVLDSPTGDFLVNQLRAGSLDATIVYRSNALAHPETLKECELVEIHSPDARAHQPYAVGVDSDFKGIMSRFREKVLTEASKETFLSYGFHWEANTN